MQDRPKLAGMRRLVLAFVNSWQGFKGAFRSEAAFRQEVALAVVLLPLGVWLGKTPVEKALLVASVLLVLIVELLNTGIETVVDRIGLERHELSGLAKDVGSTAVLLSFARAGGDLGLPVARLSAVLSTVSCMQRTALFVFLAASLCSPSRAAAELHVAASEPAPAVAAQAREAAANVVPVPEAEDSRWTARWSESRAASSPSRSTWRARSTPNGTCRARPPASSSTRSAA